MTFGVTVLGEGGLEQLNENYQNFVVVQTGQFTGGDIFQSDPPKTISYPQKTEPPIILFRPDTYGVVLSMHYANETECKVSCYNPSTGIGVGFKYAIVETIPATFQRTSQYGLEVYAPGAIAFSSDAKYFSCDAIPSVTTPIPYGGAVLNLPAPAYGVRYFSCPDGLAQMYDTPSQVGTGEPSVFIQSETQLILNGAGCNWWYGAEGDPAWAAVGGTTLQYMTGALNL